MLLKYRKIVLKKDPNGKKTLQYNGKNYNELSDKDFNLILEKINFGNSFSLPDRMIQDFISDGTISPTFKSVKTFNNNDLETIIKPFKKGRIKKDKRNIKTIKIKGSKKAKKSTSSPKKPKVNTSKKYNPKKYKRT